MLALIIFVWTPPHSGACVVPARGLSQSGLPMLPVTHGVALTRLHILMYTWCWLRSPRAIVIDGGYVVPGGSARARRDLIGYAWRLYRSYTTNSHVHFSYSIVYLSALFAATVDR